MPDNVAWQVIFNREAARDLRKLGEPGRGEVLRYLRVRIATTDDPRRFGKPLLGDLKGYWRYRVGDFRIVARFQDDVFVVLVVTVGHRRAVYD